MNQNSKFLKYKDTVSDEYQKKFKTIPESQTGENDNAFDWYIWPFLNGSSSYYTTNST